MATTTSITRDEWLKAVGDAVQPCDPDALTLAEVATMLGVDRQMAYRQVKRLIAEGKAIATQKIATNAHGHARRRAAYKLVKHEARPATHRR